MVAADHLFDETLARSVYAAMPKETKSFAATLLRNQVEVIYHTDFGVRDEALRLAKQLDTLLDDVELSPASIAAQMTASLALHIVDSQRTKTTNLERLFERCLAASMTDAAVRISVKMGCMHFDFGELDKAVYWCDRAAEQIERSGIKRLGADYLTLRIDLALEHGDLPTAQKLIDSAPQHFAVSSSPRARREYLVYRTLIDQNRESGTTAPSDIQRLLEWHDRAKHLGRHDDHMQVLWTALWRAGRRAEASKLMREYLLLSRREQRPANFRLQSRTKADPIWEELGRASLRGWARASGGEPLGSTATCTHHGLCTEGSIEARASDPAEL
jgi:hypothetical protein